MLEIEARLFPRLRIERLGLAPLTSMYFYGEAGRRPPEEYRPELHDSDGLLMATGTGEWLWRPLRNPSSASRSLFQDRNPRGFGLMQRDRLFEHYQDLDLAYHRRPSYWIEPIGDWAKGPSLSLNLPTTDETNDNIVAYWRPKEPIEPGTEMTIRYRLRSISDASQLQPGGRALNSFRTKPRAHGSTETVPRGAARFLVDFVAANSPITGGQVLRRKPMFSVTNGRALRSFVMPNAEIEGYRP